MKHNKNILFYFSFIRSHVNEVLDYYDTVNIIRKKCSLVNQLNDCLFNTSTGQQIKKHKLNNIFIRKMQWEVHVHYWISHINFHSRISLRFILLKLSKMNIFNSLIRAFDPSLQMSISAVSVSWLSLSLFTVQMLSMRLKHLSTDAVLFGINFPSRTSSNVHRNVSRRTGSCKKCCSRQ